MKSLPSYQQNLIQIYLDMPVLFFLETSEKTHKKTAEKKKILKPKKPKKQTARNLFEKENLHDDSSDDSDLNVATLLDDNSDGDRDSDGDAECLYCNGKLLINENSA